MKCESCRKEMGDEPSKAEDVPLCSACAHELRESNAAKKTDILALRRADWDGVEREVVLKLRLLRGVVEKIEPNETSDRLANDLFLPCLRLLGEFCTRINLDDSNKKGDFS